MREFKFKVGDRVRVTEVVRSGWDADADWLHVGQEYTVQEVHTYRDPEFPYKVRENDDPDGDSDVLRESQLELVTTSTVYKLEVPPEPEGVDRVRPVASPGRVFERRSDGLWYDDPKEFTGFGREWESILSEYSTFGLEPLPAAESEYDAAVRWFREHPEFGKRSLRHLIGDFDGSVNAAVIVSRVLLDSEES